MAPVVFLMSSAWVVVTAGLPRTPVLHGKLNSRLWIGMLCGVVVAYLVGLDVLTTPDRIIFYEQATGLRDVSLFDLLRHVSGDPLFGFGSWIVGHLGASLDVFNAFWAVVVLATLLLALAQMFEPWQRLVVFFAFIASPITVAYMSVALRQGMAMAVLLVAIGLHMRGRTRWFYAAVIAAPLFHWSAVIPAVALFVLTRRHFTIRSLLIPWMIAAGLFVLHLQQRVLGPVLDFAAVSTYTSDLSFELYLGGGADRLPFLAFSAAVLGAALWARKALLPDDKRFELLLAYYIVANTYFLLLGFVAFSDRVAAFSWFTIPVLLAWPVFQRPRYIPVIGFLFAAVWAGVAVATGPYVAF